MAINVTTLLTALAADLNSADLTDAELIFWTAAELYEFADEAIKWLARNSGAFVAVSTLAASGSVDLGATHLSTIFVAVDGSALREASVRELEALDAAWETATGIAKRYTLTGAQTLRIYKAAAGSLEVIQHQLPADITSGAPTVAVPPAISGFLAMSILGAARAKEGEASMPEVAAHCVERTALFARVLTSLYGGVQ